MKSKKPNPRLIACGFVAVAFSVWGIMNSEQYDPELHGLPRFVAGYEIIAVQTSVNTVCFGNTSGGLRLILRPQKITNALADSVETIPTAIVDKAEGDKASFSQNPADVIKELGKIGIVNIEGLEILSAQADASEVIGNLRRNSDILREVETRLGGCPKFGGPPEPK